MRRLFQLINRNVFLDLFSPRKPALTVEKQLPLITISREMGSGGRPIAQLVAKKLKKPWKVFHEDIVKDIAKETHLEKKLIKEVDETKVPLIEVIVADFFGKRYVNLGSYYKHLTKILSTIGHRGYAIIVGRGAHYLFPHALKVRTICEMPQRIEWMMQYEKFSKDEAVRQIDESDKQRLEFEQALYNHDIRKAHHYDLVIRTGKHLSILDAADLIVMLAKRKFKLK